MGRSPCCEKVGLKKGPWTPEEDQKLLSFIQEYGHGSWRALPPKAGLQRCGKSCRLRWTNYLRPDIKRGKFSLQEEQTIIQLHALLGNRWSAIANHLPKRTDNEIKNYWNTHLKKRLTKMGIDPVTHKPKHHEAYASGSAHAKDAANLSHMAQWESARLEAEARLGRESNKQLIMLNQHHPLQLHHHQTHTPHMNKATSALPCLDVLKVWQGLTAWSSSSSSTKPMGFSGMNSLMMAMDDLESPTSTLNFSSVNYNNNNNKNNNKNNVAYTMQSHAYNAICTDASEINTASNPWFGDESIKGFCGGEAVVEMMVYGSDEQENMTAAGAGAEEEGRCGGSNNVEENRDYWDSILNFVNASPSGSPVF